MITLVVFLKKTESTLGYGYQHIFHGYISELLGDNSYGNQLNKYTYSNLCGYKCTKAGLVFKNNPYFYIRTSSEEVWKNFLSNIKKKINIFDGFSIESFTMKEISLDKPFYETNPSSPILVSKKFKSDTLTNEEIEENERYLVNNVINKAKEYGFDADKNLSIKIISQKRHTDIMYRGIINKGRNFRLSISCDGPTKEFILTHGLGRSTSCGFGFLI